MSSYKELIVWQKAFELTKLIYLTTRTFPKEETYGLISQMRRASVAIVSNIAEGYTRRGKKEFTQFLYIAYGSGAELETQLLLAKELSFIKSEELVKAEGLLTEVMKILNTLLHKLTPNV